MNTLHQYLICLGSNEKPETHLSNAQAAIRQIASCLRWGETLVTPAEGNIQAAPYHNCAALLCSTMEADSLNRFFKEVEKENGRTSMSKITGVVPLDIDILSVDQRITRPADFNKSYVQKTLKHLLSEKELKTLYIPT